MDQEILIFLVGLGSSLFASFVSGTLSFVSMSAFFTMGIPAHLSLSILKFGATLHQSSGLFEYIRKNKVMWKYVLPITLIGVPFVILGTKVAIAVNEDLFEKIMRIVLILFIPITLLNKNLGTVSKNPSKKKIRFGYFVYSLLRFWSSIFPFGHGILMT